MYEAFSIEPPFFELGPKAYLYGAKLLKLAQHADRLCEKYGVRIIITPQCADIRLLARETQNILVFAQHVDALTPGRGIGATLPEAVREAGAVGTLLNHAERKLATEELERTIDRAHAAGLATMVCADDVDQAVEIARMAPNIMLVESPSLIEAGKRSENDQADIGRVNRLLAEVNPRIHVLHGGGMSTGEDAYNMVKWGAEATGSTSGVILAPDPFQRLEDMIRSMRRAWDEFHRTEARK
jgi:triosephosphate isomerase